MTNIVLFTCPEYPGGLRLTKQACSESWKIAKKSDDRMKICKGCKIGARNAGKPITSSRKKNKLDNICARCHKSATRYVYGRICISCANRGYEFVKNKNAKGKPPVRARKLFQMIILYLSESGLHYKKFDWVASMEEAEIGVIKQQSGEVVFGRCSPPLPGTRRYREMVL